MALTLNIFAQDTYKTNFQSPSSRKLAGCQTFTGLPLKLFFGEICPILFWVFSESQISAAKPSSWAHGASAASHLWMCDGMHTWPMFISIFSSVSIWAAKPPDPHSPQLHLLTISPADKETSLGPFIWKHRSEVLRGPAPWILVPAPFWWGENGCYFLNTSGWKKVLECWNVPECITFIKNNTPNSLLTLENVWCHKVIKITWYHHSHTFLWNEGVRGLGSINQLLHQSWFYLTIVITAELPLTCSGMHKMFYFCTSK